MDVGLVAAKGIVTVVATATVVGGVVADMLVPATARQHFRNPNWPPHAKFHNGQTVWLGILTGVLAIALTWFTGGEQEIQFHIAVIVTSLVWLSMLGASVLPGTRWVDSEFETHPSGRRVPPQLRLALALLALLMVAELVRL